MHKLNITQTRRHSQIESVCVSSLFSKFFKWKTVLVICVISSVRVVSPIERRKSMGIFDEQRVIYKQMNLLIYDVLTFF